MQFNKYTHIHRVSLIPPREDQCEWHRMTRMTGPDCVVMCNLINTHTHTHTLPGTPSTPVNEVWSLHIVEYVSTEYGCQSCSWSAEQGNYNFPYCPRSCRRNWYRETDSAVPSRVGLFINTQTESGAYSRATLLPTTMTMKASIHAVGRHHVCMYGHHI